MNGPSANEPSNPSDEAPPDSDPEQRPASAVVRFLSEGLEVQVPVGSSILAAAESVGAPEGSHCGGVCSCSTCHVYIRAGTELLSEPDADEADLVARAEEPRPNSRLGCQAKITTPGVVEVVISEESFQTYLDMNPDLSEAALRLRGVI